MKNFLKTVENLGYSLTPGCTVLDFGCGAGEAVRDLQLAGFVAFGCDIQFHDKDRAETDNSSGDHLRQIELEPYRLPFEDNKFDFIMSDQVFEHVQNYSESIAEICRVLKPDGFCLHIFPSRNKPIEVHVFVPFSSVVRAYPWLWIWAKLGVRNPFQKGLSASETAKDNHRYLMNNTNYLSKTQLQEQFSSHFEEVLFCEESYLKNTSKGKIISRMAVIFPFLPTLFSTFRSRVVFTRKPIKK